MKKTRRNAKKKKKKKKALRRPLQKMPAFVRNALQDKGLLESYRARPAYQKNDYLSWITSAARDVTKQSRLAQMLKELAGGDRYMKMVWRPGTGRG